MNSEFLARVTADFSQFNFESGENFYWSFSKNTIFYLEDSPHFESQLLHELGHALCNHQRFSKDIDLVKMELEAWEKAKNLAKNYNIKIPQDLIEDHLDTYRDWLHRRSLCAKCKINGFQQDDSVYVCPACQRRWRANDARFTELRRYQE